MMAFLNRFCRKKRFNKRILRVNDISILILDERWNHLFDRIQKTREIKRYEEVLRRQIKDETRLTDEARQIPALKKKQMGRIIELTEEAFDKNNQQAKYEMELCQKEIRRLNKRAEDIEEELYKLSEEIKKTNINLLEHTVNVVYFKMKNDQKRLAVLEKLIKETKEKLESYVNEKESLLEDYSDIYSYFHDLLGVEELEKLDREYFKDG